MPDNGIGYMWTTIDQLIATAGERDDAIMDRTAWDQFCDVLRAAGSVVLDPSMPATAIDRASGFRTLLVTLHFGLDRSLGNANPYRPCFSKPWPVHLNGRTFSDPNCVYRTAIMRADARYRIHGKLGNSPAQSLNFWAGQEQVALVTRDDLDVDDAGNFELFVGPGQFGGPSIAVPPGTNSILSREFFMDWAAAAPSRLLIDCLDERDGPWPVYSAARVAKELEGVAEWVRVSLEHWSRRPAMPSTPNSFQSDFRRDTNSLLPSMCNGRWDLGPDECLLVEWQTEETPYWSVQLSNAWLTTLDAANHQSSLNGTQAHIDEDGVFRAVVAARDPGVANWLDTLGHSHGQITLRVVRPRDRTVPRVRLIPFAELPAALPAGTRMMTPAGRSAELRSRSEQMNRLMIWS